MNNNTSLYNTVLLENMENSDTSWSDIKCDWSTFSFKDELIARECYIKETIQRVKESDLLSLKECEDSNFEEDLENFERKYRDSKKENYDILKQCEEARRTRDELIESCKKLESTCGELSDIKNSLESEISKITSDYKLHKASYKTALQHYNNFDFNVVIIVESSDDDIFVANITFKFAKHIKPIKVVVNRNERKIIEVDSHGLMDTQNFEDVAFDPLFLCNLRQKVLDSVSS